MHKFAWVMAVLSPLVISPITAVAAQPDWWLIFGSGDQPKRQVMYADAISVADTPSKSGEPSRSVDVVQVFEDEAMPAYVLHTISFQCKAGRYRVDATNTQMRSGKPTAGQPNDQWEPVAGTLLERPYDFVCKASSRRANSMIKIGNKDAVTTLPEFTIKAFW